MRYAHELFRSELVAPVKFLALAALVRSPPDVRWLLTRIPSAGTRPSGFGRILIVVSRSWAFGELAVIRQVG